MKRYQLTTNAFSMFNSPMRTRRSKSFAIHRLPMFNTLAIFLLTACLVTTAHAAPTIPGVDIIIRKSPGGSIAMGQGGFDEVPADFFGPGSLPFGAEVEVGFGGLLINRRLETDFDVANPADVPVEIVSLTLMSVAPIEPVAGSFYDITIEMTGNGSLTLNETDGGIEGGGFVVDSFFDITYQIDFVPIVDTPGGPLNLNGEVLMELAALDPSGLVPWSHLLPTGGLPAGGTNFVMGSDGLQLQDFFLQTSDGSSALRMATAIPEPTSCVLGCMGAILVLSRRRKRISNDGRTQPLGRAIMRRFSLPLERMKLMRSCYLPTIIATIFMLVCQPTWAQRWDETLDGGGDAIDLLPGQITSGNGPLLSITGAISNPDSDVDTYCITIDDPDNFSATVSVASSQEVSQLWLFDQFDFGVAHSVDFLASGGFTTTLISPFSVKPPSGLFYLSISRPDLDPLDISGNPIFTPNNPTGQIGPVPSAGPPVSWGIPLGSGIPGPYTIDLAGAAYCDVPEPSSVVLMAMGLGIVTVMRKRKRALQKPLFTRFPLG